MSFLNIDGRFVLFFYLAKYAGCVGDMSSCLSISEDNNHAGVYVKVLQLYTYVEKQL